MDNEMTTFLGNKLHKATKGILYLCEYQNLDGIATLQVVQERQFYSEYDALQAYSNIPNPESQMAGGKNHEAMLVELKELHANMRDQKWLNELGEYL